MLLNAIIKKFDDYQGDIIFNNVKTKETIVLDNEGFVIIEPKTYIEKFDTFIFEKDNKIIITNDYSLYNNNCNPVKIIGSSYKELYVNVLGKCSLCNLMKSDINKIKGLLNRMIINVKYKITSNSGLGYGEEVTLVHDEGDFYYPVLIESNSDIYQYGYRIQMSNFELQFKPLLKNNYLDIRF